MNNSKNMNNDVVIINYPAIKCPNTSWINDIAVGTNHPNQIITGSWDGKIQKINLNTNNIEILLTPPNYVENIRIMCLIANQIFYGLSRAIYSIDIETKQTQILLAGISYKSKHGHCDYITALCSTPNNKYLISGSNDKTIKIINLDDNSVRTLTYHNSWIRALVATDDLVVSSSKDCSIRMFDLVTEKVIQTIRTDGREDTLALDNNTRLFTGNYNGTITIYDISQPSSVAPAILYKFPAHNQCVRSLNISDGLLFSSSDDCMVKIWAADKQIGVIPHPSRVCKVVVSDNKIISGRDGNIHINVISLWPGEYHRIIKAVDEYNLAPHLSRIVLSYFGITYS